MDSLERKALITFMGLVLRELHPNLDEYPIADMEENYQSSGGDFVGTPYQDNERLISAFLLDKAIQNFAREY